MENDGVKGESRGNFQVVKKKDKNDDGEWKLMGDTKVLASYHFQR